MTEERSRSLGLSFTRYVEIARRREPSATEVKEVLRVLRKSLWEELRRKGLAGHSPTFLGMVGHPDWNQRALDDLAVEAFGYVFVQRMKALQGHLEVKADLSGLVRRNLRHFIFERQRKHDPIGYRLFDVVRGAGEQALAAGDLTRADPGTAMTGSTVLMPSRPGVRPVDFELDVEVASWNDDLLIALIVGRGKRKVDAIALLRRRLAELPIEGFTLKNIVNPLKADARRRWGALLRDSDAFTSDSDEPFDWSLPDSVDPYRFERLVDCVTEWIAQEEEEAHRSNLLDLWRIQTAWAAGDPPDGWRTEGGQGSSEKVLGQRKLSKLLGLSRDRVGQLIRILRRFVELCRE